MHRTHPSVRAVGSPTTRVFCNSSILCASPNDGYRLLGTQRVDTVMREDDLAQVFAGAMKPGKAAIVVNDWSSGRQSSKARMVPHNVMAVNDSSGSAAAMTTAVAAAAAAAAMQAGAARGAAAAVVAVW